MSNRQEEIIDQQLLSDQQSLDHQTCGDLAGSHAGLR